MVLWKLFQQQINGWVFALAVFCELEKLLIDQIKIGVRACLKQQAGLTPAATVGEIIFDRRAFTQQYFGPCTGGFEFAHAVEAGKYVGVRHLVCGKCTLQN
jgi:hypothetical protein